MNAQLELDSMPNPRPRWAEFDACFTPSAVVEQGLRWLYANALIARAPHVLDPSAGAGVFGQVARRLFACHTVGLEPRIEEAEHVGRNYDVALMMTAQDYAELDRKWGRTARRFDLIATNPPWWCWGEIFDACWPLLAADGVLAFLGPSTWGHSDESSEAIDVFERVLPRYQLRVRGRIAYNGGAGTDNRKCSWWVWRRDRFPSSDAWSTLTLPALPVEQRRWSIRPGTEGAHDGR